MKPARSLLFASTRSSLALPSVLARRRLFFFGVAKHHRLDGPVGGAATERFLQRLHERGRRATLGPWAIDAGGY
jgi:hypothetical protein